MIKAGVELFLFLLHTSPHTHTYTHTHTHTQHTHTTHIHNTHTQYTNSLQAVGATFAIDLEIIKEEMSESGTQYFRSHSLGSLQYTCSSY